MFTVNNYQKIVDSQDSSSSIVILNNYAVLGQLCSATNILIDLKLASPRVVTRCSKNASLCKIRLFELGHRTRVRMEQGGL